jgi:hypothetical protein
MKPVTWVTLPDLEAIDPDTEETVRYLRLHAPNPLENYPIRLVSRTAQPIQLYKNAYAYTLTTLQLCMN